MAVGHVFIATVDSWVSSLENHMCFLFSLAKKKLTSTFQVQATDNYWR